MNAEVGDIVKFTSPTRATLKGRIVLKEEAKRVFPKMINHPNFEYEDDTVFVSIRVNEICSDKKDNYTPPEGCKVPIQNINTVVESYSEDKSN